ncbi:hypothetical protein [Paenibacillus sp. 22594]|uniref:hypothetical protein n=1 Tax=Paenibacillus sp. 22594 TaxID=3453947 RepID=UPI003F86FE27
MKVFGSTRNYLLPSGKTGFGAAAWKLCLHKAAVQALGRIHMEWHREKIFTVSTIGSLYII